jgi:hypothetical protein
MVMSLFIFKAIVKIRYISKRLITTVIGYSKQQFNKPRILNDSMDEFKSSIVLLILNGKSEEALSLLAKQYNVRTPNLKVGLPKGHTTTAYGCYTSKTETISVLNSDLLNNPFIILHEFYHHLRSKNVDKIHKGTEKNANKFALDFITQTITSSQQQTPTKKEQ